MSITIPAFGEAIGVLRGMLPQDGLHTPLLWITREDFYATRFGWYYYSPRPSCDPSMFNKYYEVGRSRGLVSVHAIFYSPGIVGCTVWFPKSEADSVQGWDSGLKVSVAVPLGIGAEVRSELSWKLRTLSPTYRRYTSFGSNAPTAAEVRSAV
jgi:hypothetical protein